MGFGFIKTPNVIPDGRDMCVRLSLGWRLHLYVCFHQSPTRPYIPLHTARHLCSGTLQAQHTKKHLTAEAVLPEKHCAGSPPLSLSTICLPCQKIHTSNFQFLQSKSYYEVITERKLPSIALKAWQAGCRLGQPSALQSKLVWML